MAGKGGRSAKGGRGKKGGNPRDPKTIRTVKASELEEISSDTPMIPQPMFQLNAHATQPQMVQQPLPAQRLPPPPRPQQQPKLWVPDGPQHNSRPPQQA